MVLLKVGIVFVFLLLTTIFMIWFERRVIGRMQNRPGPNRAGPWGLLQPIADALKLPLKEDIVPTAVDKLVFFIAPIIAAAIAFVAFAIIPWGPMVSIFHHWTPLQVADLPVAVLLVLAMSSIGVYGIVLAGWASRGPYSILGALRSTAQVISYEIAMGLSFVAVFLDAGSLSTTAIVEAAVAHLVLLDPASASFVIYLVTMVGETNRIPFDLPEGEGEIVAGHMTEYSSMKFAMFFLAEYINMTTVSALATTLFLGGWRAPWPLTIWARREQRLVAGALVPRQGLLPAVLLRLAARHAAADQVRPADGARLEDPDPVLHHLAAAGRHREDAARPSAGTRRSRYGVSGVVLVLFVLLVGFWDTGYQKRRAADRAREPAAAEEEEEWDYDEEGELVKVEKPRWSRGSRCRRLTCRTTTALSSATRAAARLRGDATGSDEGGHRCRS